MTQVYNYLFGRNPRVAIQPVDLGKTSGVFFFFFRNCRKMETEKKIQNGLKMTRRAEVKEGKIDEVASYIIVTYQLIGITMLNKEGR